MGLEHCGFGDLNLPFDLAQGGESFDFAQDREPVERLAEPFRISILGFRICSPFVLLNSTLSHPRIHGLARKFTSMLTDIGDEIFNTGELDVQFVSVPTYNEGIVGIAVAEGQDASLYGNFFCHGFGLAVHVTAAYFHAVRLGMFQPTWSL